MKKKRFLKLVMSYGIQRDKAARMAARVGEFGSYEALFSSLRPALAFWQMGATARMAARAFGYMFAAREIIADTQPEEGSTAARWWVKTPNPNYGKPQAEERQG